MMEVAGVGGEGSLLDAPKLTFILTSLWEVVAQLVNAPTQKPELNIS
jgi:hypothetical protein